MAAKKAGKSKSSTDKSKSMKGVDPNWPTIEVGGHAVSEFNADRQGALSPFGEIEFPLPGDQVPYVHPTTVINR